MPRRRTRLCSAVRATRRVGALSSRSVSSRGGLDPGHPGPVLHARGARAAAAAPDEPAAWRRRASSRFLLEAIGPGHRALRAQLEPGDAIHVLGPLGNGFRPRRRAPAPRRRRDRDRAAAVPLRACSAGRLRSSVSAATAHAEAAALVPERRGRRRPDARHRTPPTPAGSTSSRAGRSRCCDALAARSLPDAQLAWEAPMACGYGACYGCVVEIDGVLKRLCVEGPVLEVRVILLNASGCLDALDCARGRRALDALRHEDRHAAGRARATAPVRIAETDAGMLNSIGLANPGHRRLPRRRRCRALREARAARSGSPSAASRAADYARRLCARLDDDVPRSSSTSRARTSTRRPSRRPRSSPPRRAADARCRSTRSSRRPLADIARSRPRRRGRRAPTGSRS